MVTAAGPLVALSCVRPTTELGKASAPQHILKRKSRRVHAARGDAARGAQSPQNIRTRRRIGLSPPRHGLHWPHSRDECRSVLPPAPTTAVAAVA